MRCPGLITTLALAVILLFPIMTEVSASGAVQVGEPLHLYIRRQPVEDMTYLYFQPPDEIYNNRSRDDPSYRETLMSRGSGNDSITLYYPQIRNSNFLQFEPNSTLDLSYNLTISATRPVEITDTTYHLKVMIEIDFENDGQYDRNIEFVIDGNANSSREVKKGIVNVDMNSMKRFDGRRGGRIRLTLSRADDIASILTIYCGYKGYNSRFQLPYSKYKYEPGAGSGSSSWPWIIAGGGILIIFAVAYFYIKGGNNESDHPKYSGKRGSGGKR